MKKVDIIYSDAGLGPRSAARGLERALREVRPDWRVRALDLIEIFAANRPLSRGIRAGIDRFNLRREREGGLAWSPGNRLTDPLTGRLTGRLAEFLAARGAAGDIWGAEPPDAVVSVTPRYNPALYRCARRANPTVRCLTLPVEFEEAQPGLWFAPKAEQYYLLATRRLEEQARATGIPASFLRRISGLPIDPGFYEPLHALPGEELARLGLDPALPTGLVSFGGQRSSLLLELAQRLAETQTRVNLIFLSGADAESGYALCRLKTPYRKLVLSYTEEPPILYHRLAQFVIGKPGAATITEALIARTPLIAIPRRGHDPVGRAHADWLRRHQLGVVVDELAELPRAIRDVTRTDFYRRNAARAFHRGVFDAAEQIRALTEGRAVSRRPV